ncbi:MAG: (Fe-S)-binding protein [Acidobacteria bacterium]|nr:(Fe-S)-binding protein [Acidobacteriota bacterium]
MAIPESALSQGSPKVKPESWYSFHVDEAPAGDRVERFLAAFAAILHYGGYRGLLDTYVAALGRCSRCTVSCPIYQVTGDPRDIPCYRTHLLLDVYKRHFSLSGWVRSRFGHGRELTEELVDELAETVWRCNACRRCSLECPLGIDHALLVHLGRYILSMARIAPKALQVSVREQLEGKTRNTSKLPRAALISNLEFLEEELEELLGLPVRFPVDQPGRDMVFFCAVSDYLMEADTLMGNAAVLFAAGDAERWTIGSGNFDAINYGLFYNDWHLERIIGRLMEEVLRLDGRSILIGECGHASRSAKEYVPVFGGDGAYPVQSITEYTYRCLQAGRITLDGRVITERVTYHDPCNMARSGWIVDQPRAVLKSFVKNFVEMEPHGRANYCCGGGGGLVSLDETHEYRMEVAGRLKAEQLRQTRANICVAPCANCKKQLKELVEHYQIPCRVVGLHDLILQALVIPGATDPRQRREYMATQLE